MQAMHKMVMDPVSFAFLSADAQLAAGKRQFASSHGENREKDRLFSGVFRRQCRRGRGQYIRLKRIEKADDVLSQSCPEKKCFSLF
jgi:hypothetical protein